MYINSNDYLDSKCFLIFYVICKRVINIFFCIFYGFKYFNSVYL